MSEPARKNSNSPVPQASRQPSSLFAPSTNAEGLLHLLRANPTSLQASQIVQLQRLIGNAAVSRLLKSSPQQPADQAVPSIINQPQDSERKIQRLIGFEIETRIPLHYRYRGHYYNPDYDQIHADVGTGDGSEFGVDKEGPTPIAEFVSGPVSDSQISKNFERQATTWVSKIKQLHTDADGTPPTKKLSDTTGSAPTLKNTPGVLKPKHVHFGFLPNQSKASKDDVAIQVTHGLRLDQVAKYMANFQMANKFSGRLKAKEESLHEVGPLMDTFMDALTQKFDPTTIIPNKKARNQALAEVRGFFSLMGQYLVMGSKGTRSFLKNQPTLFYKSKLSDVCGNLMANNAYAAAIFTKAEDLVWIIAKLLEVTSRDPHSSLLTGSTVTTVEWLGEVLRCVDDRLFEEAKNPWGKDIAPGRVGGGLAVVLEHRDMTNELVPETGMNLQNPNKIVKYMVKIFKANKKAQKLHH